MELQDRDSEAQDRDKDSQNLVSRDSSLENSAACLLHRLLLQGKSYKMSSGFQDQWDEWVKVSLHIALIIGHSGEALTLSEAFITTEM